MAETVNLVKLCVGAEKVEDLIDWQAARLAASGATHPCHVTRMWPKREAELLNGGSLYWVFKGMILARQRLIALDEMMGEDGIRRCGLVLDRTVIRTEAQPKRPFQGWRYLPVADAPADLPNGATQEHLPPALATALADLGVR
jgi:hypothetical protein